jgi:hypothetical protein
LNCLHFQRSVAFFDGMVVFRKGRQRFDWCEVNGG